VFAIRVACLSPACVHVARCRGLCQAHYALAGQRVNQGAATWAELEAAGQSLPALRSPWRDGRKWLAAGGRGQKRKG
jgi:hypothetical protein